MHPPVLNTAIQLAFQEAKVIRRHLGRSDRVRMEQKSTDGSWVTELDLRAEQALIEGLEKAYPDHAFLAEERGFYKGDINANALWIIDPLDGTNNFVHGFPHIAISMAFRLEGRLEHALVYDIMRNELFLASRGRGAFIEQRRMRIGRADNLDHALIGASFSLRHAAKNPEFIQKQAFLEKHIMNTRRMGSAALDFAYLAAGRLDACWSVGLKPWDSAAGTLLVREAGGFVTNHQGESEGDTPWDEGNIIAANGVLHARLLEVFKSF
jgi:myo-inositol-1(or 4)-monophosphatase